MKRTVTQPVGDILAEFVKVNGLTTPLYEYRMIKAWPEIVGDNIAEHCRNIRICNQVLHVELDSPALRQQLRMRRSTLCQELNNAVGSHLIYDIAVH